MHKKKTKKEISLSLILISLSSIAVYTLFYILFEVTLRIGTQVSTYLIALAPIYVLSILLSYGIMLNYAEKRTNKAQLALVTLILGSILFLVIGYAFYVVDALFIFS